VGPSAENALPLGPRWPSLRDVAASLPWALLIGVVFFSVYPLSNWLAAQHASPWQVHFGWELAIPFLPHFVWLYLSMYLLFVLPPAFVPAAGFRPLALQLITGTLLAGAAFVIFPAELGFTRVVPTTPPYDGVFAAIHAVDLPHNLVPSLHVVFTTAIALACADFARPWAHGVLWTWLVGVIASTLLVHQHHLVDVMSALVLVAALRRVWPVRRVGKVASARAFG
jgi:membrane-associated phospholipid phosphatase